MAALLLIALVLVGWGADRVAVPESLGEVELAADDSSLSCASRFGSGSNASPRPRSCRASR